MLVKSYVDALKFRIKNTTFLVAPHGRKESPQGFVIVAQKVKTLGVLNNVCHDDTKSEGPTPILLVRGNSEAKERVMSNPIYIGVNAMHFNDFINELLPWVLGLAEVRKVVFNITPKVPNHMRHIRPNKILLALLFSARVFRDNHKELVYHVFAAVSAWDKHVQEMILLQLFIGNPRHRSEIRMVIITNDCVLLIFSIIRIVLFRGDVLMSS